MELKPGYKQSEVGVIPEDWEVKPLCGVAQIRSGIAKNANTAVSDPVTVHYLRVANVQDGFLDLAEMSTIEVSRSDLQRFAVVSGDVLMNEGGDRDKLGRGSIWRGEFQPCIHQNHVFVVRCGVHVVPDYLTIWSAGSTARQYFLIAGKQTTNLASINKTALGKLPILVPPLPEQRAIAEALSDVDGLLGGLDRLITKKHDLKQATMQQLLTGQTRLPGFHGEWEVKRLEDVAQADWGNTSITKDAYQDHGYAAYSASGQDGYVSWFEHDGAGVVISAIGAQCGKTWLTHGKWTPIKNTIWFKGNGHEACTEFLYWKTCDRDFWPKSGQAQPFVSVGSVRNASITMPQTLGEQTAIAQVLTDMDAELAALERRRDKTRALKQGMMQELLTGRIRLPLPEAQKKA